MHQSHYIEPLLYLKIAIFSMVGMMQAGLGVSLIEASPLHNEGAQRIVQLDDRHEQEKRRHEQEMRRHDGESAQDWNERQWRENQQHDQFR